MKITFNKKDDYLVEILEHGKFLELETKIPYYIFGLKNDPEGKNSCIEFSYNNALYPIIHNNMYWAQHFFRNNSISFKRITGSQYTPKQGKENIIRIGLRHDVRQYIKLSALILETIIDSSESKIKMGEKEAKKIIHGLPEFH
jgi:hypothetical protein